jgi:CRP-like cAMP-binding protein
MNIPPELYEIIVNEEYHEDKDVIIKEDAHGNWMYIILEGQVKVKKKTPSGLATIDTLKQGEIFGEMNLLMNTHEKRSASVVADGPVVLGLLDTNRVIEDLNSLSPQLRKFISTLAKRLQGATGKVVEILAK